MTPLLAAQLPSKTTTPPSTAVTLQTSTRRSIWDRYYTLHPPNCNSTWASIPSSTQCRWPLTCTTRSRCHNKPLALTTVAKMI